MTERGPAVSFKPVFPEPGRYAVWAQFAWRGAVRTHRVEVEVLP